MGRGGSWRVGRLLGAEVRITPSLLVMGLLLVLLYAPQFDELGANSYLVAATLVVGLFVSVFVHEIAHVAAARAFGMRVPSVTLHLLGGETEVLGASRRPAQEFVIAVVGPLASFLIGIVALQSSRGLEPGVPYAVLWSIGVLNLLLAAVNMLPGLPLDGGRVFRALLWWITGNEHLGVVVAARLGQLAAAGLVLWVLLTTELGTAFSIARLALAALVAVFLWQGATASLVVERQLAWAEHIDLGRLARPGRAPADAPPLRIDLSGREALLAMSAQPAAVYALVDAAGRSDSFLLATDVDRVFREGP